MFIVDSNIWIEVLLRQKRSEEVKTFLSQTPSSEIAMSEFTFGSIGILLFRHRAYDAYKAWTDEILLKQNISRITLKDFQSPYMHEAFHRGLDFDDAYQYVVAKTENLHLVSFDQDFDKTDLKRFEPLQALELWKNRATA